MVVAVVFYDNTIIRGCGGQMVDDGEEKKVGKLNIASAKSIIENTLERMMVMRRNGK